MKDCQILFVDDDKDILAMVSQYLVMHGYHIDTVDNGIDALGLVKENPVDIVFTDYKMPGLNGLDLARAVKRVSADTEIVLMTAYGTPVTANDSIAAARTSPLFEASLSNISWSASILLW